MDALWRQSPEPRILRIGFVGSRGERNSHQMWKNYANSPTQVYLKPDVKCLCLAPSLVQEPAFSEVVSCLQSYSPVTVLDLLFVFNKNTRLLLCAGHHS